MVIVCIGNQARSIDEWIGAKGKDLNVNDELLVNRQF